MIRGPYPAEITDIHDGDTCSMHIDLGFGIIATTFHCRFFGINAPELNTTAGKASLLYLKTIMPIGSQVNVLSHDWDKYGGRFDGEITIIGQDKTVNIQMVASGHAVEMP